MEIVYLSQLENVQILWPGDMKALADFVIRCNIEKDKIYHESTGAIQTSHPTVNGLAGRYANTANISCNEIRQKLNSYGLNLGAIVKRDSEAK